MNSTARSFLSISALALAAITIASALLSGLAAPLTVSCFSFLAIYGIIEIGIVSNAARPPVRMIRTAPAPVATPAATTPRVQVPAVVEYPAMVANCRAA